jgi:hypothetical protein
MPGEHQNPDRRTRGFHPRQAMVSHVAPSAPTNKATFCLFNDSTGPHILAVRNILSTATVYGIGYLFQGSVGAITGRSVPIVVGGAKLAGVMLYNDQTTVAGVGNYVFPPAAGVPLWNQPYPLAYLQPGWSFIYQLNTAAAVCLAGFFWEALLPEELDYMDD